VAGTEVIEAALAALEVAGHAVLLAQAVEIVVTAGDQLVGIGLMTHVPDDPIVVEIEGLIQGKGELDHAQTGAEVTATGTHHLEMALADLAGDSLELGGAQAMQLIRMRQLA